MTSLIHYFSLRCGTSLDIHGHPDTSMPGRQRLHRLRWVPALLRGTTSVPSFSALIWVCHGLDGVSIGWILKMTTLIQQFNLKSWLFLKHSKGTNRCCKYLWPPVAETKPRLFRNFDLHRRGGEADAEEEWLVGTHFWGVRLSQWHGFPKIDMGKDAEMIAVVVR